MVFISKDKLDKQVAKSFRDGVKSGKDEQRKQLKQFEINQIQMRDQIEVKDAELNVLRSTRQDSLTLMKSKIDTEDLVVKVNKIKELQDKREKELDKRTELVTSEEEKNYVKGYADGVSDGLHKIHEITEKDRDNMAKIAMVAAASYTSIDNMKEINNEFRLTEGSTNKKTK